MIEILWHGRGGQGAFTAAKLLGAAYCMNPENYALAFPSFGPERRGAPMRAFTKLACEPIGDRSAIEQADYVVYLDDTLLPPDPFGELKPNGTVVVNTLRAFDDERIVGIDADGLSRAVLGRAIPNTALLGALSVLCADIGRDDLRSAIEGYMPARLHEKNFQILDDAIAAVEGGRI